jgi:hypothetical protein
VKHGQVQVEAVVVKAAEMEMGELLWPLDEEGCAFAGSVIGGERERRE